MRRKKKKRKKKRRKNAGVNRTTQNKPQIFRVTPLFEQQTDRKTMINEKMKKMKKHFGPLIRFQLLAPAWIWNHTAL